MHFGETEKAVEAYGQAIAMLDDLVAEFPHMAEYRGRLGVRQQLRHGYERPREQILTEHPGLADD
jgi:hypothetical protein